MVRLRLRTSVSLITLTCFLALILPFCVPSAESKVLLPGGGEYHGPPGSEGADPDDIAVNSPMGGEDVLDKGQFGFGEEQCIVIGKEEYTCSEEAIRASMRRDSAHWLWVVWSWTRQLVFNL